ncbi:nascent polypeptide-associated complex subunit alpha, muscle-specific form-like [Penaeus chinensis]|uniref:nascent polypeptide-associated complex subunit alpha, muscle-specific form-like n=1 Tax=Penaeus chinensis TaxID=139456 RepID=UPI001FB70050|nr:nascent polypeptide-associated complex subunit alpha, muscle-specific form-like [Penaeus chinensis]
MVSWVSRELHVFYETPMNVRTSARPFAAFPCPPTPSCRGIRGKPLRTGKRAGIPEVAGSPISYEAETEAQVPRRPPTAAAAGKPFTEQRQRRGLPSYRPSGAPKVSPAEGERVHVGIFQTARPWPAPRTLGRSWTAAHGLRVIVVGSGLYVADNSFHRNNYAQTAPEAPTSRASRALFSSPSTTLSFPPLNESQTRLPSTKPVACKEALSAPPRRGAPGIQATPRSPSSRPALKVPLPLISVIWAIPPPPGHSTGERPRTNKGKPPAGTSALLNDRSRRAPY